MVVVTTKFLNKNSLSALYIYIFNFNYPSKVFRISPYFPAGQCHVTHPSGQKLNERCGAHCEGVLRRVHQVHQAGNYCGKASDHFRGLGHIGVI